ncbi:PREDICTED: hemoglobin subunit beta-like [Nanorana parkeri]|uniref:hemoglobin subunit beta-like n=1 Tax=Nanorana parkeri TaxID=125878 RepID=UPI00085433A2|nr:PREDICTED: hemoglobin subunit beta-like [Nanorana parkeri]
MGHSSEIINAFWPKVDTKKIGGEALTRYLTNRVNLGSVDAISHNSKVIAHGEKVLAAITEGLKHLDNLKPHFAKLSQYHSEKLHVDPANFYRFGDVLIITLALQFHQEFTPEVQCALQSAFHSIGNALAKCYH